MFILIIIYLLNLLKNFKQIKIILYIIQKYIVCKVLHFGSILSGQDTMLREGDVVTDPFNVLNVKDIYIDKEFYKTPLKYIPLVNSEGGFEPFLTLEMMLTHSSLVSFVK